MQLWGSRWRKGNLCPKEYFSLKLQCTELDLCLALQSDSVSLLTSLFSIHSESRDLFGVFSVTFFGDLYLP